MDNLPFVIGFSALIGVACFQALNRYAQQRLAANQKDVIATVLFFPDESARGSSSHQLSLRKCGPSSLSKMLSYMRGAVHSIDVCVMVFTCKDLAQTLVQAMVSQLALKYSWVLFLSFLENKVPQKKN